MARPLKHARMGLGAIGILENFLMQNTNAQIKTKDALDYRILTEHIKEDIAHMRRIIYRQRETKLTFSELQMEIQQILVYVNVRNVELKYPQFDYQFRRVAMREAKNFEKFFNLADPEGRMQYRAFVLWCTHHEIITPLENVELVDKMEKEVREKTALERAATADFDAAMRK